MLFLFFSCETEKNHISWTIGIGFYSFYTLLRPFDKKFRTMPLSSKSKTDSYRCSQVRVIIYSFTPPCWRMELTRQPDITTLNYWYRNRRIDIVNGLKTTFWKYAKNKSSNNSYHAVSVQIFVYRIFILKNVTSLEVPSYSTTDSNEIKFHP